MRRLLLLGALLGVAACQDSPGVDTTLAPTSADVTGSFKLTTANGQVPPYQWLVTSSEVWTVMADRMVIAANNTWVDTTDYSVLSRADGSTTTRFTASAGTWAIANNQITFVMTTGGSITFTGSVGGNTLTTIYNGARYYYSR